MDRLPPPAGDPRPTYASRAARSDDAAALADRTVRSYGRIRLATFAAAVSGAWALSSADWHWAAWGLAAGAVLIFGLLVAGQRRARRRRRRAELIAEINRRGIARVERRWDDLPSPRAETPPDDHDYAKDLDLYGRASLLHLVGTSGTPHGQRTLRDWLLSGADTDTVAARQEAVSELAAALGFRDRLAAEVQLAAEGHLAAAVRNAADHETSRFLRWAEDAAWLPGRRGLRWAAAVLPPMNVAGLALYFLGVAPGAVAAWPLLASLAVLWPRWKAISRVFSEADDGESGVRGYGPVLAHLANSSTGFKSRCFAAIRERIGGDDSSRRPAHREIGRLRRLLDMADLRRSPLFHVPLALVLFWDVHVLAALERWKGRSGHRVRDWLRAMGEAEALAALAALAADHPDWKMPTLDPDADTVRGRSLGHPLLPPVACVRNDVEVGPRGSFLLVTGSNMSGKSTLLKAIGLNVVLARAGAPVCARSLRLPSLRVVTSMTVRDSLADGVSFFMAELRRLKQVVDAAEAPCDAAGTLYLLDEILQGTNSAERRIAARTVVRRLLASDAVGAVTTHDLTLADAEDLTARSVAVHFTESVREDDDDQLVFDYRLRSGTATSTNALRLLGLVGLDGPPGGAPSSKPATTPASEAPAARPLPSSLGPHLRS